MQKYIDDMNDKLKYFGFFDTVFTVFCQVFDHIHVYLFLDVPCCVFLLFKDDLSFS